MLKNTFLYRIALHELKKSPFPRIKIISLPESFTNFTQSRFLRTKNFFCTCLSSLSAKITISTNHKPFFCTSLSLLPSKAALFHPPLPISTPLNLLFAKNTAILLIFALTPCAVKPESRTDSNHCRRYPENYCFLRCRLPNECRSLSPQSRFDRRFESSPESRGSQTSGVLFGSFCTTQKE